MRRRIEVLVADAPARGGWIADGPYVAWHAARTDCRRALAAWRTAESRSRAAAHVVYRAALDREEAAARNLETLRRLGGTLLTPDTGTLAP
jgi:hypothetical protein